MSNKPKLFLLDAYALIYRSYYAFINSPRINSKKQNTSAIFGFTNTLIDVINNQKPSHIAVVFDAEAETHRAAEYSDYKANREAMPEDIRLSIPYIKKIIQGFNIPVLESPGYEADDIIGTLAKAAERENFEVFMMTPDKDFGQLVSDNIKMYKPGRMGKPAEVWGVEEVCKRFDIERPEQVIDILGLMGDSVDNIPGIAGVGEKTAMKFIKEFGSVEGLLENSDKLKGKMKEKVEAGANDAIMSKKLATIILDVPVPFEKEELVLEAPNKEVLMELFNELEFRNIAQRLFDIQMDAADMASTGQMDLFAAAEGNDAMVSELKNIDTLDHNYHLVSSSAELSKLCQLLNKSKAFCFDTETSELNPHNASLLGIAFAVNPNEAFYVSMNIDDISEKLNILKPIFERDDLLMIGHNCKYDILVLKKYNIEVKGKIFDTMLAHYLLEPDSRKHGMDWLAVNLLGYQPISISELIGPKGKQQKSMADIPVEKVYPYACEDADITLQLYHYLKPRITSNGINHLFENIEAPLVTVLADMEAEGIRIDIGALQELSGTLAKEILEQQKTIFDTAGHEFNISSPKQVGEVLYDRLKVVDKPKKTKTGQYATGEDVLQKIANKHPIIEQILSFRELVKLKNTYVDTLPDMVFEKTSRIHTSFNQVVTATGRLSSDKPNLQNIPIRTERGQLIRKAFIPRDENYILMASDYSQIELRIMAELSQDPGMIEAFGNNQDIHAATASKVFNVTLNEVSREQRSKAKMVNFGIIYGISAFGLAERLSISRSEAKEIIDAYFDKYSKVKSFMDDCIENARKNEYVETILGRRRYLRDINSRNAVVRGHAERNAINAPIQGSAADMIKIAMVNIAKVFQKEQFKSKMLLQVHDELVFDVLKEEKDTVKLAVENEMKNAMKLSVPILVETGFGSNWLQAH